MATSTIQNNVRMENAETAISDLQNRVTYVTPEMFGAVGDGITDDTTAVQNTIDYITNNSNIFKTAVLNKKYKILSPITVTLKSKFKITGSGSIYANCNDAIILDGCGWCEINGISIYAQNNGIHLISTHGAIQYVYINNIYLKCSTGTGAYGIFIERTTYFNNETTFSNCYISFFNEGIYIYNPDTSHECTTHKFFNCSTENSNILGQHLVNASYITFEHCRHAEVHSKDWKTEGICNQLMIIGGYVWDDGTGNAIQFSADTNGMIIGRYRSACYLVTEPAGILYIIGGHIIPNINTMRNQFRDLKNIDNVPGDTGGVLFTTFRDYAGTPQTTEFSTDYYGGSGKINRISIIVGGGCTRTIKIGNYQTTISNTVSYDTLHIFDYVLGYGWVKVFS